MQQRLHSSYGEPTGSRYPAYLSKVCSTHGDHAFNAWVQPHHTDTTESLFHRDADQRKAEAIERMGRICDLNSVGWSCG